MSKTILFRLGMIMVMALFLIPSGCGGEGHRIYYKPDYTNRFYVPQPILIKPGMVRKPEFEICKFITIINAQTDTGKTPLGTCVQKYTNLGAYTHKWSGNLRLWTDTAVTVLKAELKRRGVTVTARAPKVLRLTITRACLFWGFNVVGCPINLRVDTGNGYTKNFEIDNRSIDLYDSCDGAVAKAVAAMLNDEYIRSYLTCPSVKDDSDCDTVIDEIDKCPGTPRGVRVDADGCPLDSDGDGVPDYRDKCPGTPRGVRVDADGCPLDSDGDGVSNYKDKCPGTPGDARVDERGCWVISDTLFDFDKYQIKPQYYPLLDQAVMVFKNNPSLRVEIQGHTDYKGTEAYNQQLSEHRAQSVMSYLIRNGIEKNRLFAVGYGKSRPKASSRTDADRALNRRVELHPVH